MLSVMQTVAVLVVVMVVKSSCWVATARKDKPCCPNVALQLLLMRTVTGPGTLPYLFIRSQQVCVTSITCINQ